MNVQPDFSRESAPALFPRQDVELGMRLAALACS